MRRDANRWDYLIVNPGVSCKSFYEKRERSSEDLMMLSPLTSHEEQNMIAAIDNHSQSFAVGLTDENASSCKTNRDHLCRVHVTVPDIKGVDEAVL